MKKKIVLCLCAILVLIACVRFAHASIEFVGNAIALGSFCLLCFLGGTGLFNPNMRAV
jgi:hypothetical protein